MKKENLLNDIAKILMLDRSLLNNSIFFKEELYWDTLTMVSILQAVKQHYNFSIQAFELMECGTIGDLFSLLQKSGNAY